MPSSPSEAMFSLVKASFASAFSFSFGVIRLCRLAVRSGTM